MINTDNAKNQLTLTRSTWITESTTKGWTIGAKISGTVGKEDKGSLGAEISAQYSDLHTKETRQSREVSYQMACKPHSECRFETWTFHVELGGACEWYPMLDCSREISVCDEWPFNNPTCQQFEDVRAQCPTVTKRPKENCKIKTPLYEAGGKPFSKVVAVTVPLNGKKRSQRNLSQAEYEVIL